MTGAPPAEATSAVARGWRIFFLIAGLFNVLGGTAGLLDPGKPWRDAGMAEPLYPFPMQLLFASVILFGIGYLMVWRAPLRHRGIVWLGLGSKLLGLVFGFWAVHSGQLPPSSWWQPLVVDLPWALGFAGFLWRTR